jgi:hypothetical protein
MASAVQNAGYGAMPKLAATLEAENIAPGKNDLWIDRAEDAA